MLYIAYCREGIKSMTVFYLLIQFSNGQQLASLSDFSPPPIMLQAGWLGLSWTGKVMGDNADVHAPHFAYLVHLKFTHKHHHTITVTFQLLSIDSEFQVFCTLDCPVDSCRVIGMEQALTSSM